MKIESFKIVKGAAQRQNPYILIELNGNGCGIEGCNCSPPNFISVSDGANGLAVALTDEEAKELKENGRLEIVK